MRRSLCHPAGLYAHTVCPAGRSTMQSPQQHTCPALLWQRTLVTNPSSAWDRLADTMPPGGLKAHTLVSACGTTA